VRGPSRALARRYAGALLDVAESRGADAAKALRGELRDFGALLRDHAELASALERPGLASDVKRRFIAALGEKVGASELLRRLLDLLATRDRLTLLPVLIQTYGEMLNARRGVVSAEAVSAGALSADQRQALAAALAKVSGLEVELAARVEPQVLGGLLVRMGGTTYDGTVRARLAALRRVLVAGS
jgi:F-type H+-transporting ATPase subunit delta